MASNDCTFKNGYLAATTPAGLPWKYLSGLGYCDTWSSLTQDPSHGCVAMEAGPPGSMVYCLGGGEASYTNGVTRVLCYRGGPYSDAKCASAWQPATCAAFNTSGLTLTGPLAASLNTNFYCDVDLAQLSNGTYSPFKFVVSGLYAAYQTAAVCTDGKGPFSDAACTTQLL